MEFFEIPIVIYIFKRHEKIVSILQRIACVSPKKLYIISDGPRNVEEYEDVVKCRKAVEENINWECEVIKNYSGTNRGVYENIGEGALWVLGQEESAIFLEDDNLPEVSFFYFCRELLEKYKDDTRVLWICGSNYLEEYESPYSYVFSSHMLPCGWASWGNKFPKYYDGKLEALGDKTIIKRVKRNYESRTFYQYDRNRWMSEYYRINKGIKPISWDYQMSFTLRLNRMYGIVPVKNQIRNIGVDEHSIHGGTSFKKTMTQRFCGMNSISMEFPLIHPPLVFPDEKFENRVQKIILPPLSFRTKGKMVRLLRKILKIDNTIGIKAGIKKKFRMI